MFKIMIDRSHTNIPYIMISHLNIITNCNIQMRYHNIDGNLLTLSSKERNKKIKEVRSEV